jgi:hypothetical protein
LNEEQVVYCTYIIGHTFTRLYIGVTKIKFNFYGQFKVTVVNMIQCPRRPVKFELPRNKMSNKLVPTIRVVTFMSDRCSSVEILQNWSCNLVITTIYNAKQFIVRNRIGK